MVNHTKTIKIVAVSDLHARHHQVKLPKGDILVVAGDFTRQGSIEDVSSFNAWLGVQHFTHKVVVAGNHDWLFQRDPALAASLMTNATYLQDEEAVIEGIKFYGSPWQPEFCNWAFNLPRDGTELAKRWLAIPNEVEILVTHGPPHGVLDEPDMRYGMDHHVGCEVLRRRMRFISPMAHIFGHIHEGYGVRKVDGTWFLNASVCNNAYETVNPPIVLTVRVSTGKSRIIKVETA